MRKIAVAISKGGTGKTTTAVSLAHGLARAGHPVLLVDLDTQGQCSSALGLTPELGLADLVDGTPAQDVVVEARPGLHLLAGGRALAGLKRDISRRNFGSEQVLAETLSALDSRYAYVILDTPPSFDELNINALFYATEILAPVSLEALTVRGLLEFHQTLQDVQRYREEIALRYVLPTFLDRRLSQSEEILQQLRSHFGDLVQTPIRINVRLSEAPGHGQTIFEYAPNSNGAEDYQTLVNKVIGNGHET